MIVTETALPGVKLIEPRVFGDDRSFFMERTEVHCSRCVRVSSAAGFQRGSALA